MVKEQKKRQHWKLAPCTYYFKQITNFTIKETKEKTDI